MKQKHFLTILAALSYLIAASAQSATILYDFSGDVSGGATDKSSSVTSNDFGLGVAASTMTASSLGSGSNYAYFNETTTRTELRNGTPGQFEFTITIPTGVQVNLTSISFDAGVDSGAGSNDLFYGWDVSLSTGSASPASADLFWDQSADPNPSSINHVLSLSGASGLTDTVLTVTFVNYFATGYDGGTDAYSGGSSGARHATLDNITLVGTASAIPEPHAVILALLGTVCIAFRRNRNPC